MFFKIVISCSPHFIPPEAVTLVYDVFVPIFTVFGVDNGRAQSVYQHFGSAFVVMDPEQEKDVHNYVIRYRSCPDVFADRNRRRLKILHSTVEGAERIAFGLVKNLLFKQNLHARIVTCGRKSINQISLPLSAHNQHSVKTSVLASMCQHLAFGCKRKFHKNTE